MESSKPAILIDLNDFKLHLRLKNKTQLTLHFNSPSRRFYLSVIALLVNEMKNSGKIKTISLKEHLDLVVLLNESVGGAAGSSGKESLLTRIYVKWKNALPNLEEAPLFRVLGKKKVEGDGGIGKIYSFTDVEKDGWANLFDYFGSKENVRLKFAIDKIGIDLNETSIIFGETINGDAWDLFISSLKKDASVERMKYPPPDQPSIAVLPFINMSQDPNQEYFSDGITEDLITDLSKISGLMVIARNSTFCYKGKNVQIKQVAEDLDVRYILEGSVRREDDELRINAQLIDTVTGHHVWAERYDGTRSKIFALQDQITQKIVSGLAVKLTVAEMQALGDKDTNNVEAHDAFLRGWGQYLRLTPDDIGKAVASFRRAVELDPNYGRAYAALALVHWTASTMGSLLPGLKMTWLEARLRSREYLRKGMHPQTSIAHQVTSQMCLFRRQYEEAISEMERALSLDPNNPSSHAFMGWTLNMAGRPKEAIEYLNRGMRLDPHNPARYLIYIGVAHFCMGDLKEAVALVEKAMRLNPELSGAADWIASWGALLGREREARAAAAGSIAFFPPWGKSFGIITSEGARYGFPFRDRTVADQFVEGLRKAGYWSGKISDRPFHPQKENQLTGEEIKTLLFGSTITGNLPFEGRPQWWMEHKEDGTFTSRGFPGISPGSGKSRIEGDLFCSQFQKGMWGLESCGTVYRNPAGKLENKDEYAFYMDWGFSHFSVVR
ncbi:MAG TPA: tetratricopeptide repeat protein [Thermodesulfobacteriota bacterium]|nr:tetratricopeptide repeat protein [Thermodesulfobacteriota bacterium]